MRWKAENSDRGLILVSASGSSESINERALEKFSSYLEEKKVSFNKLNLKDFRDIPILLDKANIPERIREVSSLVSGYELVVIFAPEHNGYFSAFFKNILDWLSLLKIPFLERSRVIVVSVSTTERTQRIMEEGVKYIMGRFTNEPVEFINFNRYGKRSEQEIKHLHEEILKLII